MGGVFLLQALNTFKKEEVVQRCCVLGFKKDLGICQ